MKVEQLSVFLENKVGRLAEITDALTKAGINIRAISLADTSEFGILRLIVDKHDIAKTILKEKGYPAATTDVLAVHVQHNPGGLDTVVQLLGNASINIEYMYGFPMEDGRAIMVFRVNDIEKAIEALKNSDINVLSSAQIRQ